jgi:hypothetical protein
MQDGALHGKFGSNIIELFPKLPKVSSVQEMENKRFCNFRENVVVYENNFENIQKLL